MTFRSYIALMSLLTLFAGFAWWYVIQTINPDEAGIGGIVLFYLTLGVALIGLLHIIFATYRIFIRKPDVISRDVSIAFQQAVLLSLVTIISLFLSSRGLLSFWILLLIIVPACVIEYVFLRIQHARRPS